MKTKSKAHRGWGKFSSPYLVWLIVLWLIVAVALTPAPVVAADEVQVDPAVTFTFGEQILFQVRLQPAASVTKVVLFYHPALRQGHTYAGEMTLEPDGSAYFVHDLQQNPLPPFAPVYYWFRITLKDGTTYTTPSFSFVLEDNRFEWQEMQSGPFVAKWYEGDAAFAQKVLDAAVSGLVKAQEAWLAPTPKETVTIYIYADLSTLQKALGAEQWVAGHASPTLGALYVALPSGPQQELDIRRLVPHELVHYLLYQFAGDAGYHSLPTWLNEGLASNAELVPRVEYAAVLNRAVKEGHLLPIADLCHAFPNDASGALLAYAESASFTEYLLRRYGRTTMHNLVGVYAQGVACDEGAEQVLGESISRLDRDWQAEVFHLHRTALVLAQMFPWLLLGLVLVASLGLGAWLMLR